MLDWNNACSLLITWWKPSVTVIMPASLAPLQLRSTSKLSRHSDQQLLQRLLYALHTPAQYDICLCLRAIIIRTAARVAEQLLRTTACSCR